MTGSKGLSSAAPERKEGKRSEGAAVPQRYADIATRRPPLAPLTSLPGRALESAPTRA